MFHYMLMRWTGSDMVSILIDREISVGLFLTPSDKVIYDKFTSESSLPERLHFTIFMAESKDQYPINHLRNLAIEGVRTSHLWLTDMDMWPSCTLPLPLPRRQSPRGADGAPSQRTVSQRPGGDRPRVRAQAREQLQKLEILRETVAFPSFSPLAPPSESPGPKRP